MPYRKSFAISQTQSPKLDELLWCDVSLTLGEIKPLIGNIFVEIKPSKDRDLGSYNFTIGHAIDTTTIAPYYNLNLCTIIFCLSNLQIMWSNKMQNSTNRQPNDSLKPQNSKSITVQWNHSYLNAQEPMLLHSYSASTTLNYSDARIYEASYTIIHSSKSESSNIYDFVATDSSILCFGQDSCKNNIEIFCGTGDCKLECNGEKACDNFVQIESTHSNSFQCLGECPHIPIGMFLSLHI